MFYDTSEIVNYFTVKSIVAVYDLKFCKHEDLSGERQNFWQLVYVESGTYCPETNGEKIIVERGEAIFFAPDIHHCDGYIDNTHLKIISFFCTSERLDFLKNRALKLTYEELRLIEKIVSEGTDYFEETENAWFYGGYKLKDGVSPGKLQALKNRLEILLIKIIEREYEKHYTKKSKNYKMSVAETIAEYLADNIGSNITLSQIAENINLSVSSVKQIFRESYKSSVIDYFINLKIEKAKELIEGTDLNFTQIASYLSFDTLHYFSRVFKQRTGLSPSEYAQRYAHKDY